MKKKFFLRSALFLGISLLMLSCSNSNKSQEAQSETEQEELAPQIDFTKLYEEALSITCGEVEQKDEPGPFIYMCYMPVTIHNNSAIPLSPEDYIINYKYEDEITVDGMLEDTILDTNTKGPELSPNSDTEFVIKQSGITITGANVKLKISQDEFEKRYK